MDDVRARRLADRIQQVVADMLERRIKDPRLGFVTVTDARLTGDLRDATVFYTVYGPPEAQFDSAAALESAKGVIRSEVGRQTGLRHTPSLAFVRDQVPETAAHIEGLLARARAADEEVARARATASPAGEADPYRQPAEARTTEEASQPSSSAESRTGADNDETGNGPDREAGYSAS